MIWQKKIFFGGGTETLKKNCTMLLLVVVFLLGTMPAAAEANIENASLTLEKVLYIEEDATVPTVEFFYTVEPVFGGKGSVVYNIRDGVAGATITSAKFSGSQNITNGQAVSAITLDFSGCDFPGPGIYGYKIEEIPVDNTMAFTLVRFRRIASLEKHLSVFIHSVNLV